MLDITSFVERHSLSVSRLFFPLLCVKTLDGKYVPTHVCQLHRNISVKLHRHVHVVYLYTYTGGVLYLRVLAHEGDAVP